MFKGGRGDRMSDELLKLQDGVHRKLMLFLNHPHMTEWEKLEGAYNWGVMIGNKQATERKTLNESNQEGETTSGL